MVPGKVEFGWMMSHAMVMKVALRSVIIGSGDLTTVHMMKILDVPVTLMNMRVSHMHISISDGIMSCNALVVRHKYFMLRSWEVMRLMGLIKHRVVVVISCIFRTEFSNLVMRQRTLLSFSSRSNASRLK